jgi:hypothetical protein
MPKTTEFTVKWKHYLLQQGEFLWHLVRQGRPPRLQEQRLAVAQPVLLWQRLTEAENEVSFLYAVTREMG